MNATFLLKLRKSGMYRILGPGYPIPIIASDSEVFAAPAKGLRPQFDTSKYSVIHSSPNKTPPAPKAVRWGEQASIFVPVKKGTFNPDKGWKLMPQFSACGQVRYIPISEYFHSVGDYYLRQPQIYHHYIKDEKIIVIEEHKIEHSLDHTENFVYTKNPFGHYKSLEDALQILKLSETNHLHSEYIFVGMHFADERTNITFNTNTKSVTCSNARFSFSDINSLDDLRISLGKQIVAEAKSSLTAAGIKQVRLPFPSVVTGMNLQFLDAGQEGEIYRLLDSPDQCFKRFFRIGDIPDHVLTFLHLQEFINRTGLTGVRTINLHEVGNDYICREFVPHQLRDMDADHPIVKQAEELIETLGSMPNPLAQLLRKILRTAVMTLGHPKATQSNVGIDKDNVLVIYDLL